MRHSSQTLLLLLGTTLLGACSTAPFAPASVRIEREASSAVTRPTAESLQLELVLSIPTSTDTPSPAFSPDGRLLSYRDIEREASSGEERYTVHVLDLANAEDITALSLDSATPAYDPYAYGGEYYGGYYGGGYYGGGYGGYDPYGNPYPQETVQTPTFLESYHPVMLDDKRGLVSSSSPIGAKVFWFQLRGTRSGLFSQEGFMPRVSPDGRRVLLQRATEVAELDTQGSVIQSFPGYLPEWSPRGSRYLVHITPYRYDTMVMESWDSASWSEDIVVPEGNVGGLVLVEGSRLRQLTSAGGRPSWFADERRFAFELGDDAGRSLELFTIDEMVQRPLVPSGEQPTAFPLGDAVAYVDAGWLWLTDLDGNARALDIEADEPRFSADGRFLIALRDRPGVGLREREILLYAVR